MLEDAGVQALGRAGAGKESEDDTTDVGFGGKSMMYVLSL